jgi:predicted nuclease of predicted toxin-antitoxin system
MKSKPSGNLDCERPKMTPFGFCAGQSTVIVTKDQDFADRSLSSKTAPIIVWLRVGNTSNRALLTWLLPLLPDIISRIETGDKLVEVREKL